MSRAIVALATVFALFAVAEAQQSGALSVANLNISPNPVVAGSNFTITFQLYNNYNYALNNVNLNLVGSYPLLNFSPSQTYLISSMGQGLYGGENSYFSYTFHVPADTPTGVYTIYLEGTYQTTSITTQGLATYSQSVTGASEMPISVYINGMPNVSVSAAATTPIMPGNLFNLELNAVNTGGGIAKNLSIYANSTPYLKVVGVGSTTIGSLQSGVSAPFSLSILASQNLTNSTYYLPLRLVYKSSLGKAYSSNLLIPISVAVASPSIAVSLAGGMPPTLYRGYNQTLTLQVQNTGLGLARNISIDVSSGNGIELESSVTHFFIGSLPPGGVATEQIFVAALQNVTQNATVNAHVSYYPSNYQELFSKYAVLNVSIAPAAQFTITSQRTSAVPGSTDVPVTYTIKNTGNIAAQSIQLSFQTVYPVNPIDSSAFVAELQPGQTANVTFLINVDSSGEPGSYPVTIYEQWKQPNGVENQLYSGSENYYIGIGEQPSYNTGYGATALVIAVLIIAAISYRAHAKKKALGKRTEARSK